MPVLTKFACIGISLHVVNVSNARANNGIMSPRQNLSTLSKPNPAEDVPDFLSHGKLRTILSSSLDEDMDEIASTEEIQSALEESVLFEWQRADLEEEHMGELRLEGSDDVVRGTTSFLVCMSGSGSGYERKEILKKTMASFDNPGTLSKEVLYNKDDFTCIFSTMTASKARMIQQDNDHIMIQPLPASAIISRDAIARMRSVNSNDTTSTVLMTICPGIVDSTASAQILAENLINRFRVSIDASSINSEGSMRKLISDDFLWTKSKSDDAKSHKFGRLNRYQHNRALIYQSLLEEVMSDPTSGCAEALDKINIEATASLSLSYSLSFEFLDDDEDKSCSDAFIIGLSVQPEVCSVEREEPVTLHNDYAQWILQSHIEEERPFWDAGIKGENQIAQISDSGLDTNNCYFYDVSSGELRDGTVQSSRRKVVQYKDHQDDSDTEAGHGTHVAGTVVGKKSTDGTVNGEVLGFADGVAIEGKVAFFDIGNGSSCCLVPSASYMLGFGIAAGAAIHSASWGSSTSSYDTRSKQYDDFMYNNENFMFLTSAGNSGDDFGKDSLQTVGSRGIGKNLIAVGASESHGDDINSWGGYMSGTNYLAYFSSRGTSPDGRIKPDIVAPGYAILSACARPAQTGECDPTGTRPSYFGSTSHDGIRFTQGTSMACPAASGATLLIRQYLQEGFYPSGTKVSGDEMSNPSGSLLKAILINGGETLIGVNNVPKFNDGITASTMYDAHQGFGRVNLLNSLPLAGENELKAFIKDKELINDGDTHSYMFQLGGDSASTCSGTNTFSATLVWSDPPVTASCASCVLNDLDLLVEVDSVQYYPNGGTAKDSINNVERVRIDSSDTGDIFELTVDANNLSEASQKYALIVTGCGLVEGGPTSAPSSMPTIFDSTAPSLMPTFSTSPSLMPTFSTAPSLMPTFSTAPSSMPTFSSAPSSEPSSPPSVVPSALSSDLPSLLNSLQSCCSDDDSSALFSLVKALYKGKERNNVRE